MLSKLLIEFSFTSVGAVMKWFPSSKYLANWDNHNPIAGKFSHTALILQRTSQELF